MTLASASVAVIALALFGCEGDQPKFHNHPEFASAVGVATMESNGVISLQFPPAFPSTQTEGGLEQIRPGDRGYQVILDNVGGLKPGETKPLKPIESPPNSNSN